MEAFEFRVIGHPRPQGSKRHVGKGILVEQSDVKTWRSTIVDAAVEALGGTAPFAGAVTVIARFSFCRPKGHYRTGKNAHLLRDGAPTYCTSRALGDSDKLARSVLDALTAARVFLDDSQVVQVVAEKGWCHRTAREGATIIVTPLEAVDQHRESTPVGGEVDLPPTNAA